MLEKLDDAALALLPKQRDKWLKIGLSTEMCDFEESKKAAIEIYTAANLVPPKYFFLFDSPLSAAVGAVIMKICDAQAGDQVWDQVRNQAWDEIDNQVRDEVRAQVGTQVWYKGWYKVWDQVWDQVRNQVGVQVRGQVRDQVRDQVGDQVRKQVWAQVRDQAGVQAWDQVGAQAWDQVWAQVRNQVGDQVWDQVGDQVVDQVWDQVGSQVWDQVGSQVRDEIGAMVFGCHDANWLGFYETFGLLGINVDRILPLIKLAENCGWWTPYRNAVFFQHRPRDIRFDAQRRLHNETGPSVLYRDGFAVYAWHGVRVPRDWIEDRDSLTAETAIKWENVEERRAACEIVGWANILDKLNARTIERHPNPMAGELLEVEIPEIGRERFMRVKCGTGRMFAIPVPPGIETVEQGQRWLNFIPDDMPWIPSIRT